MFMSVGGRASGWDAIVYSYIGTLDVVICRKGGGGVNLHSYHSLF